MGKDRSPRRPARSGKTKAVAERPVAAPDAWGRALDLVRAAVGKLLDVADRAAETITHRRRPS